MRDRSRPIPVLLDTLSGGVGSVQFYYNHHLSYDKTFSDLAQPEFSSSADEEHTWINISMVLFMSSDMEKDYHVTNQTIKGNIMHMPRHRRPICSDQ